MKTLYIKNNNKINLYKINIINKLEMNTIIDEINSTKGKHLDNLIKLCMELLHSENNDVFNFSINFNNIITDKNYTKKELNFLKRILSNLKFEKLTSKKVVESEIIKTKKRTIIDRILGNTNEESKSIEVPLELENHIDEELEIIENIKIRSFDRMPDNVKRKVKSKLYDKFPKTIDINK